MRAAVEIESVIRLRNRAFSIVGSEPASRTNTDIAEKKRPATIMSKAPFIRLLNLTPSLSLLYYYTGGVESTSGELSPLHRCIQ